MNKNLLLHYNAIAKFNEEFYKDVLIPTDMIESERNFSKLSEPQGGIIENFWGYIYEKQGTKYLLSSQFYDDVKNAVAFKPKTLQKVSYRDDVYQLITRVAPITMRKEERLSFRECVDRLNGFSKTEPRQGLLMTLLAISSYLGRVNARIATPPGSGKDSIIEILNGLFGKATSVVNPTPAKLESLANKNTLLAINEVNDIVQADFRVIEQFLLDSGAFKNSITKRSRAFAEVGEFIDIQNLSILLFYNDVTEYPIDRDYFDHVAKGAVKDRFPAFRFHGVINEDFSKINSVNVTEMVRANMDWYKDLIYSLEFHNEQVDDAWRIKGFDLKPTASYPPRWNANLMTLFKYVALYAENAKEFEELKSGFEVAIEEYVSMINYLNKSLEHGSFLPWNRKTFKDQELSSSIKKDDGQKRLS